MLLVFPANGKFLRRTVASVSILSTPLQRLTCSLDLQLLVGAREVPESTIPVEIAGKDEIPDR